MKIAISGSYSTGKTTMTVALSLLTGIDMIHAKTMREILPIAFPGKKLEKCLPEEIVELIFYRLSERIREEVLHQNGFISDGSSIQEWAYCMPRLKHGMNPNEIPLIATVKKYSNLPRWKAFQEMMEAYYEMACRHVTSHYDCFIHLPIEFSITKDGHRPVNERFRRSCDELLRSTYRDLKLSVFETNGNIHKRLQDILNYCQINPKMDIDEAVELSKYQVYKRFNSIRLETEYPKNIKSMLKLSI